MARGLRFLVKPSIRVIPGLAALLLSLTVIAWLAVMSISSLAGRGGEHTLAAQRQGAAATAPPINQQGINLNTATRDELMSLPGIGEYLAEQVMRARERQPFHFIEDLSAVKGIGKRRIDAIRPLAHVPLPVEYADGK